MAAVDVSAMRILNICVLDLHEAVTLGSDRKTRQPCRNLIIACIRADQAKYAVRWECAAHIVGSKVARRLGVRRCARREKSIHAIGAKIVRVVPSKEVAHSLNRS